MVDANAGAWTPKKAAAFKRAYEQFLKNCTISSKDLGKIQLGDNIYTAQRIVLDAIWDGLGEDIHDFKVLKSRQLGISTITRTLIVFWAGMHPGFQSALVFDTDSNRQTARREIEELVRNLPKELKFPKIVRLNRDSLVLDNDSSIQFKSAGVRRGKGSGTLGRSLGLAGAWLSEICSYDNPEGLKSFRQALSEENPNRLYIYESTARGFNDWHDMWVEAKNDNLNQRTVFLGWWSKDTQRIGRDTAAFQRYGTEPANDQEKARIALVRDLYGFEVSQEQLAWYRRKVDPTSEREEGDEEDAELLQEQPWCVVGGTRVGTDSGILKITDVAAGMNTALGKVLRSFPTGKARIWRARTKLGYEIRGTGNHPLITTGGAEVELQHSLGRPVQLQPPKFGADLHTVRWRQGVIEHAVTVTPDFARLIGLFMGDGTMWGSPKSGYYISFACTGTDIDTAAECERLLRECFDVEPYRQTVPGKKGGCINVRAGSRKIFETFKTLGLLRDDTSKTMRKVHVPEFIWRSPKYVVREFLRGLFEADGFNAYDTNRCAIFSKWPDFLNDVQLLLLGFGITSRLVIADKRAGDGHSYTGRQLEMRTSEAVRFNSEIGFLSARKLGRSEKPPKKRPGRNALPISYVDTIETVVDEGVEEEVFNLTVDGNHWFDANGILTHNTETEAFQMSGSSFFAADDLARSAIKASEQKYTGYRFFPGANFLACTIQRAQTYREVQFKIWEEPIDGASYVVAADPAFGHDENNDRSALQVFRCYADGLDQVAEYANASTATYEFAWFISAVLGYYNNCEFILEINGPGEAVWNEFRQLKVLLTNGYLRLPAREAGLGNILNNVRNYIYQRSDSMTAGSAWHFKTTGQLKVAIMERLRDFHKTGELHLRSLETIEEMKSVTRDGDSIKGEGRNKDDRVISAALAVRCWEEKVRRRLLMKNQTREAEIARLAASPRSRYELFTRSQMDDFFARRARERRAAAIQTSRMGWRGR